jgi:hypothetical protein
LDALSPETPEVPRHGSGALLLLSEKKQKLYAPST